MKEINQDLNQVFLLALADCRAAQGPDHPPDLEDRLIRLWQEALHIQKEIALPLLSAPPLITGNDLIQLGLTPGPLFKKIIDRIKDDQWSGAIATREEALDWIESALEKKSGSNSKFEARNPKQIQISSLISMG